MSRSHLPELLETGHQLLSLLEHDDIQAADKLVDQYLGVLDSVFQNMQPGVDVDNESRQALLQFQVIHDRLEHAKSLTEDALLKLSKAGRASDLYKLNAG